MQKIFIYIFFVALMVAGASCKSVRKITTTDNSTNTSNRKKIKRKVAFIDGIEITPGAVVKSKHKPATTKNGNNVIDVPTNLPTATTINIEKINKLQLKYAIILDTYIENVTNINLFAEIDDWWGTNYCYGGTSKQCIDCSGFTGMLAKKMYKILLPRTAQEQYTATNRVNREQLKEGDLVFFKSGRRGGISHVGMYLHNNKFAHASTSNGVMISDLDETYWKGKYAGAGKIIN